MNLENTTSQSRTGAVISVSMVPRLNSSAKDRIVITMRSFAEEFKLGTIETLMTAPVRDWEVVFSKFIAALIFYLSLWLPSLLYFLIFGCLGNRSAIGSASQ